MANCAAAFPWAEQFLAPTLTRGDVVFMDNVSVHKVDGIEEAIEARGAIPFDLPAYSPDLNPIEQLFAKLKALLRKVAALVSKMAHSPAEASAKPSPGVSIKSPELNAPHTSQTGYGQPKGERSSPRIRVLVADMRTQWRELDRRIAAFDAEFVSWARENEDARRLASIPGVGVMIATALIAAIGRAESFARGRDLAAWLGLVPRQSTTGGKPRLLGISKRGNKYLRKLLIHGARAALPHLAERDTPLGRWAKGLLGRAHQNVAVVALANKLARIAWAVLRRGESFAADRSARGGIAVGARRARRAERPTIVCERWKARWPDSRPASWNPGSKNGAMTP